MLAACSSGAGSVTEEVLPVDSVLANPEKYVDREIEVSGRCVHICSGTGNKLFIVGNNDTGLLWCDATPYIGGRFPRELLDKTLVLKGILREERVSETNISIIEQRHEAKVNTISAEKGAEAAQHADCTAGRCRTDRRVHGQENIDNIHDRMADYRRRIAERVATDSIPYLSFYYLDVARINP